MTGLSQYFTPRDHAKTKGNTCLLYTSIQQLAQVSNMLQSMAAAAERVFEFLGEPEEEQNADPARRADPACIDGQRCV